MLASRDDVIGADRRRTSVPSVIESTECQTVERPHVSMGDFVQAIDSPLVNRKLVDSSDRATVL